MKETCFRSLTQSSPERAKALIEQGEAAARVKFYEAITASGNSSPFAPPGPVAAPETPKA